MRTLCLLTALALVGPGCSNKSSSPSERPKAASDAATAKATPPARKPKGWRGYDGTRKTGTDGMAPAVDAAMLGPDGKSVQLASFWRGGKALLVFYRGHW